MGYRFGISQQQEIRLVTVSVLRHFLVEGNPMAPKSCDVIVQTGRAPTDVPLTDGWRVLSGNSRTALVARVVFRREITESRQ